MSVWNPIVNALPYIDKSYDDPVMKEIAFSLIKEETKRYKPTKNYLDYLPPAKYTEFETDIMKAEYERIGAHIPMEMLSMKRIINLELLYDYGAEAWKQNNDVLSKMVDLNSKQLHDIRQQVKEINVSRKTEQLKVGSKLEELESTWVELVGKNYEIERLIVEMQKETQELERQKAVNKRFEEAEKHGDEKRVKKHKTQSD